MDFWSKFLSIDYLFIINIDKLIFNTLIDVSSLKNFELEDVESPGKEQTEAKKDAGEPREVESSNSKQGKPRKAQPSDSKKEKHKGDETSDSEEKYLTAESSVSEEDQSEEDQSEEGSLDSEATGKVSSSPEY